MTTRGRRTATAGTRAKAVVDGTDERLEASHSALPAGIIPLLTVVEAARFLGLSAGHVQARGDIPRVNVAPPGSRKPAWRYRISDLEAFAQHRLVNPYTTGDASTDRERATR